MNIDDIGDTEVRQFWPVEKFPWTQEFVQNFESIKEEVLALEEFMNPVYQFAIKPVHENSNLSDFLWKSLTPIFFTIKNPILLESMPVTTKLMESVPNLVTVLVLKLRGNAHLLPHKGYSPDTLRFHLGISVPEPDKCEIRVEHLTGRWYENEWLIFDDYLEHEVWNYGDKPRTVLLIDTIRPNLNVTPYEAAEKVFKNSDGTRFDKQLAEVAPPSQWLNWLKDGVFS